MMKKYSLTIIALTVFFFCAHTSSAQDALELLKKMDDVMFSAKDRQGTVKITTINQSGKEKIREAEMFQKGHDFRLYRYTAPESQVGIATLSLPDGIMWMYMPAFGKPKKITLLAKSQSFSGTDFSYEDMSVSSFADSYTPTLIETRDDVYIIEMVPVNEKSDYSKIVLTLDKQQFTPRKMEYYSRGGTKFKEASYIYNKSGDYLYAEQVIMANLKKQHMTKIQFTRILFNQGLSDDLFTVENLIPEEKRKKE